MTDMKHTEIFRGGVTASYLSPETRQCSFRINVEGMSLDFKFELASKGGGTTCVRVQIGLDDLPSMLEAIATEMPEECVGTFSHCAAVASKRILQQLKDARKKQVDEQVRTRSKIEELQAVEQFVWRKHFETSLGLGEDEQEADAYEKLYKVIKSLLRERG
jgi:hypothetical protein